MSLSIGALWGIYVAVVVISFILFWLLLSSVQTYYLSISYGSAFLFATLLGAIAVFIGTAWIDPNQLTSNEKTWLSVLFIVAFLLPIFVILYIIWAGEYASIVEEEKCACGKNPCQCKMPCGKNPCQCKTPCYKEPIHTKQTIQCDRETGVCQVTKKKIYSGNDVTTVIYS